MKEEEQKGGGGRGGEVDRRQADLPLDPRRLRNDDLNHRRGSYSRDRRRSEKPLPDLFN